jgi:hypothetical protein
MAFGTNEIKTASGLTVETIRYAPSRRVVMEMASASIRENVANITMLLVARGTPTNYSALADSRGIVVKQGSTNVNGASLCWRGALELTPEDEIVCLFNGAVSGENLEFTVKVRPL